jgi:hypothetical protein
MAQFGGDKICGRIWAYAVVPLRPECGGLQPLSFSGFQCSPFSQQSSNVNCERIKADMETVEESLVAEVTAFLKALTPEAKACLGAPLLKIPHYPFRVGRESRVPTSIVSQNSRRRPDSIHNNDLYLAESGERINISREHFQIERRDGVFFLVDRNSMCGTVVEGETIGKSRNGGEVQLRDGDVIIVGMSGSKQILKFVIQTNGE